jgi:uncharacterized coiled-coil DUF342 family protein
MGSKSMEKTKVDDMLMEMITPKVKEIEERFSAGKGLSQDDINTLLLKSQYNHINHLDIKLDETMQSVKNLEGKFQNLEGKFETFKAEIIANNEKTKREIQETLNSTIKWYIGSAGIVIVLLKALDLFIK